jgi:hypothetical protein
VRQPDNLPAFCHVHRNGRPLIGQVRTALCTDRPDQVPRPVIQAKNRHAHRTAARRAAAAASDRDAPSQRRRNASYVIADYGQLNIALLATADAA